MNERNMTIREELIRLEVEMEAIGRDLDHCLYEKPGESVESIRILINYPIKALERARKRCEFIKGEIPL